MVVGAMNYEGSYSAVCTSGVIDMRLNVGIDVYKETLDLCLLLNQAKSGSKFKCFKNRKIDYLAINDWIYRLFFTGYFRSNLVILMMIGAY